MVDNRTVFSRGIPERRERKNSGETFIYPEELIEKNAASASYVNRGIAATRAVIAVPCAAGMST